MKSSQRGFGFFGSTEEGFKEKQKNGPYGPFFLFLIQCAVEAEGFLKL